MRDLVVSLEWIACAELAPLFRYGYRRKYNIRQLSSNAPGDELTDHHPGADADKSNARRHIVISRHGAGAQASPQIATGRSAKHK